MPIALELARRINATRFADLPPDAVRWARVGILDSVGVCVRPGHHCAKPLMRHLGVQATARASFGLYNGTDDVDALVEGLEQATTLFG